MHEAIPQGGARRARGRCQHARTAFLPGRRCACCRRARAQAGPARRREDDHDLRPRPEREAGSRPHPLHRLPAAATAPKEIVDAPTRAPAAPAGGHRIAIPSGLAQRPARVAPRLPASGPAALGSRRIGAAAWGRRVLGPLTRPIARLEPTTSPTSLLAVESAAQPPPR